MLNSLRVGVVEWVPAAQEEVCQDAERPHVCLCRLGFAADDLWCHVVLRDVAEYGNYAKDIVTGGGNSVEPPTKSRLHAVRRDDRGTPVSRGSHPCSLSSYPVHEHLVCLAQARSRG